MTDLALRALEGEALDAAEELADAIGDATATWSGLPLSVIEALSRYRDARAAVDDYCPRCEDGIVSSVHNAGTLSCDPADVRERPCTECEAGRALAAQRETDEEARGEARAGERAWWV